MKTRQALLVFVLTVLFSASVLTSVQYAQAAGRRGADVQIYSLQTLINQAYQMVLEGASLVMLDQMGKGGVFERVIDKRGWSMIDLGERIISDAVSGEEIKVLISEGKGSDPLLTAVKENAAQILEAVEGIRTYLKTDIKEPQLSQMHSLYTLLNHGMKMATDGANMIMLGRTGDLFSKATRP